ncbi:alpha/beta hydrolase [Streptomyces sp. RS10V-4]|uniref:alpha/beta fold hydrolase n=1 Tax=Streptomyces rhizoryzae TaxID=2932493 RepID=UPI002005949F|nr:alpha/beta hydrolase [Streptomyces rhizoryzae]MCK7625254.1 alpha/beta hydrolase [Streptomyces rhizoryzae]
MANVVLVHGAWSDGSVWQAVIATLQDEGHRVLAIQLPLTSLEEDIAWTRRQIATFDGPVTLVGHSYGGMVISGAAHHNARVTALVFVAAYAPDESETLRMLSGRGTATRGRDAIRFSNDGWSTLDPDLFRDALGADVPATTTRVLAALQKPTHSACFSTPSGRGAWRDLPCAYVLSTDDQILDPGLQRWFAERTNATVTALRSSHLSPVSHPQEVAAAISGCCTANVAPRAQPRQG